MGTAASDLRSEFLASINREFRAPLTAILGMTDLLSETRLDDEQREYLAAARFCAEELLVQVNAAQELAALSSERLTPDEVDFGLRDLLHALASEYRRRASRKGVKFAAQLAKDIPSLAVGDAVRFRQLLAHVIESAIDGCQEGEIVLSVEAEQLPEERFRLTAGLQRKGMAKAVSARTSPDLGLAVAERLARLLGGEMQGDSVAVPLKASQTAA